MTNGLGGVMIEQGTMQEAELNMLRRQLGSLSEGAPTLTQKLDAQIEILQTRLDQMTSLKERLEQQPDVTALLDEIRRLGV